MAIVFPTSPSVNETFTAGSITYKWDGDKWIGLGVTPADRLVEGSNSLEIDASNNLLWSGGKVGFDAPSPESKLEVRDSLATGVIIRSTNTQVTNTNKALRIRINSDDNTFWVSHKGFTQITINDDTDYNTNTTNTSNTTNTVLTLSNQSGSDGTGVNNYVGINFSVANGATSTAQLQYVRTGDNAGKFEFKARNTATSYPNIMTLLSNGSVGIRTEPTTNAALDIMQGYYSIMYGATNGANGTRADNTNKEGRIVQFHRDNEEEPLGAIVTFSQSTAGTVNVGGGSSLVNAATETALFAAANATTTGGTKILSATINGVNISLPAAATLTPLTLQNTTSGGDTQVMVKAFANGGGDAFIRFDCGGSDMTVGNFYQGTTNNQLCLGPIGTGAATNNGIRIDGNGLVAIGDNATSKLAGELQVINTTQTQQTNDCLVYLETVGNDWTIRQNYNSGSVISYFNYFLKQGSTVGSITYDGTNMIYGTGSDYRLKENVVPLTGAIDTVKLLQPKEFNFISNPDVVVKGFIAHELQEVIPYAVSGEKDGLTRNGEMEPQQVDLSKLVPVLTAALQEALAEIETLKGRLDAAGL